MTLMLVTIVSKDSKSHHVLTSDLILDTRLRFTNLTFNVNVVVVLPYNLRIEIKKYIKL